MTLYINTKDAKLIKVALKKGDKMVSFLEEENQYGSQILLPLISKILKAHDLEYKDLEGVDVETGPGSFTGLRVGVAVANALGFALEIPVDGKEFETQVIYMI